MLVTIASLPLWLSLPSRERGLKFGSIFATAGTDFVAPLAGAWIEINFQISDDHLGEVAPLAGAWIEMISSPDMSQSNCCRSPRGSVD